MAGKLKNSIITTANYSVSFDGSGDYIDVPHSTNQWIGVNQDFTIECWFYVTSSSGERTLIAKGYQGSPNYAEFGIVINGSNQLLGLVSSSGGSWLATPTDSVAISTNTWYHVALVRSGTTITLYKNGVVAATSTGVGAALYNHTGTIRIGQHSSGSNFAGYISNARFVNGTAVYTSAFTPPTSSLTAIANTNLLTCQSSTIIDNGPNAFTITVNGDSAVNVSNPFNSITTISGRFSKNDILYAIQDNNWKGYTSIDVDVLCVGGGGGAGGKDGSPGAAGGSGATILGRINVPTSKTLTVTVGGGGRSPSGSPSPGDPGGIGGLPGGGNGGAAGGSGASGGGGGGGGWSGIYDTSYSVFFDGTGDYISVGGGNMVFAGDFTIECWVYPARSSYVNYIGILGGSSGNFVPIYVMSNGTLEGGIWGSSNIVNSSLAINLNQWNHIALVRSGSSIRFYINGVQDTASTNSSTLTIVNPAIATTPSVSWLGYISNMRVVNGTAVYTASFTPPTAPLTAISGTSLLTCQSSTIIDNGPNAFTLTVNGDAAVRISGASVYSNAEPFVRYFIAGGGAGGGGGNEGIQNDVFAAGGGIQFNGANGTALTGGNGTNYSGDGGGSGGGGGGFYGGAGQSIPTGLSSGGGNYINPSYTINSYFSNFFDGNDYLSFPVSANYDLPADFTIEAWVHATGARTTSDVVAGRWVSGNRIWLLAYDNVNKWAFAVNDSSLITYNSTIVYNTWYHFAVTRSGTTVTMWLNGVNVGTATSSYNFTSATQPLFIGRNGDSTDGSQDWLGYISNFRIVKGTALYTSNFTPPTAPLTAISGTQVLTCKSSTIIDKSTNNFTITKNGDVIVREIHPFVTPPTINAELGGGIGLATGSVSMPANVNFFGYTSAGSGGTFGRGINNGANGTIVIKYTGYQKATGGDVVYDNGYTFHTYNSPGTFALQ